DALQAILGQANRAGVTICVVDTSLVNAQVNSAQQAAAASSTLASGGGSTASSGIGGPGTGFNLAAVHNSAGFEFGDVETRESPLTPLATGTGGIYIGGSGAFSHQLQQLHDDLTSWYQASWEPPIKTYNSGFRPIDV